MKARATYIAHRNNLLPAGYLTVSIFNNTREQEARRMC
jgi:hypothetical protein